MSDKSLRFAALIRVSTEKQEKQGESLRTQDTQLTACVTQLGGVVTIKYAGQEHATPGYERQLLEQLLADAQKPIKSFDAVIVTDPSRWSRDNTVSERGLEILRDNGILFYVGTQAQDLFNDEVILYLSMNAVFNKHQSRVQRRKSLENRIARARAGKPACGKLPFGRTYDKKAERWGIDKAKQAIIEDVAIRYLAGEQLPNLAAEYQLNHANLHKVLKHRSGDIWEQAFDSDDLNIHSTVKTSVPPLLSSEIIEAIRQKSEANRTYQHGHAKHPYLFARMVFCGHCGYAMFGQINHNGQRYYRHAHTRRLKECECPKAWVNADDLEEVVIRHLFSCFGNPQAVQKAIEDATPNLEKVREYQSRIERIKESLSKYQEARQKILRLITKGAISEEQAEKELGTLNAKEASLREELSQLCGTLENVPTPAKIKEVSRQISARFGNRPRLSARLWARTETINECVDNMTWDEKRALAEMVFGGKTPENKRMGIFITWVDGPRRKQHKNWKYIIKGHLIDEKGWCPMEKEQQDSHFPPGAYSQKALVTKYARHCTVRAPPSRRFGLRPLPTGW
jgi:site-specific DNA recombinase